MTARQEARVGTRATSGETWSYETQRAPNVGEILQTARERKGVDLARAERETKIRARHLMALEAGDLADLPALVYAKGFLRNYSTYLGLDADEMVDRWRVEIDQPRRADTPTVKPPPQPITTPSRGLKVTSGLVVALVLAAIVFAFVGYVGLQLVRFTQNPEITLSGPAIRQLQAGTPFVTLRGGGTPNAIITATGTDTGEADPLVRNTNADATGAWSLSLEVNKGENHFTITGQDPETARDSEPLKVIVSVPVDDDALPQGDLGPVLPEGVADTEITGIPSAELILLQPQKGLKTNDGRVKVEGTSDAETVTVSFEWRGNVDAAKNPPEHRVVAVKDGIFRDTFQLPKGRWIVWVSASIDGGYPAVEEVNVRSLNDKMALRIDAVDGKTRVKITKPNGDVLKEKILIPAGQSRTFRVDPDVILRVGNSKAAKLTVDGEEFGMLGKKALPVEYRLQQGKTPRQLD
ncbi:MAG: RodZ domain-containing protein [Candidatus Limnocylindrales bacterium]